MLLQYKYSQHTFPFYQSNFPHLEKLRNWPNLGVQVRVLGLSYSPKFSCINNGGKFTLLKADHPIQRELLKINFKGIENAQNFVG